MVKKNYFCRISAIETLVAFVEDESLKRNLLTMECKHITQKVLESCVNITIFISRSKNEA